jgi:TonB-linked SusC/RagA family outer membrane protein
MGLMILLMQFPAAGQDADHAVSGKVYSAKTGLALTGIGISAVNSQGEPARSGLDGTYRITVSSGKEQLLFSYPGIKDQTIFIHGRDQIDIWMLEEDDLSVADEMDLFFSKVPQKDIAGAASAYRLSDFGHSPHPSFDQDLQARLSGLQVINRSGMPGEGAFLTSRGYASLYGSSLPLVVVDGMIMMQQGFENPVIQGFQHNPLADLDKRDISSVVLLKDAASAGTFGIKASNGVLLVTTNPPRGGTTTLDVSVSGGLSTAPPQIPVMDASHYSSYVMEQMLGAGLNSQEIFSTYPFLAYDPDYLYRTRYENNTNWQDEVFRMGNLFDTHLIVRGGDARARYSISGGYLSNQAILENTSYNRFNFRFNSVVQVSSWLDIGFNLGYTAGRYDLMETGATPQTNPILASLIKSPMLTVYQKDQEGTSLPIFDDVADFGLSNPAVIVSELEATDETSKFLGVSYLNVKITDKLTVRAQFGLDRLKSNEKIFIPSWGLAKQGDGSAERSTKVLVNQYYSLMGDVRASYRNRFGFIHDITIDAGLRYNINNLMQDAAAAQNSATDEFKDLNSGKADEKSVFGREDRWSWINYYITANYILNDRYIVGASLSLDASSKFGDEVEEGVTIAGYPLALLPSAGVAWRISSEPFMEGISFLNELKIRASYGLVGSDDFTNYYTQLYYRTVPYYSITGFSLHGLYNPGLKWEIVKKSNLGFDLSMFRERLIVNASLYTEVTEDMITYRTLPKYYGIEYYMSNGGSCENRGIELLAYGKILNAPVTWEVDANFSINRNKTLSLTDGQIITPFNGGEKITVEGQPMGLFYGYRSLGVFTTREEADAFDLVDKSGRRFHAGDIHFDDLDGNGIIDEADKTVIGDPHPDYVAGIYNRFSFRGLSLGLMVQYTAGNDVFNYMRSQLESMSNYDNQSTAVYSRWNMEGQQTDLPRATFGDPMGNNRFSSRWIEDGSYFRLNSVTLSYDFQRPLAFINSLNIYITGTNLITHTGYLGYDPEFSYQNGLLGQGIDYGKIPQPRSLVIGLKVGL